MVFARYAVRAGQRGGVKVLRSGIKVMSGGVKVLRSGVTAEFGMTGAYRVGVC